MAGNDCTPSTRSSLGWTCLIGRRTRGANDAILQRTRSRLLDRDRTLLRADRLYGVCATPPAAGGRGVHAPGVPRLLPRRALVGQVLRRRAPARAGAGVTEEWAYAGFAVTLGSALIAHVSV